MLKKLIFLSLFLASSLYGQVTTRSIFTGTSWQGDYPTYSGTNSWTNLQNVAVTECAAFSCMAILNTASCVSGEAICTPPFLIGMTTTFNIPNNSIITQYNINMTYLEGVNNNGGADSGNINVVNFTLCPDPPASLNPSNLVDCPTDATFTPESETVFPTTAVSISYPILGDIFGSDLPTISQVNAGIGVILQTSITGGGTGATIEAGLSGWSMTVTYFPVIHHYTVGPVAYHQTRKIHFIHTSY